jgi:hypothetical protein
MPTVAQVSSTDQDEVYDLGESNYI